MTGARSTVGPRPRHGPAAPARSLGMPRRCGDGASLACAVRRCGDRRPGRRLRPAARARGATADPRRRVERRAPAAHQFAPDRRLGRRPGHRRLLAGGHRRRGLRLRCAASRAPPAALPLTRPVVGHGRHRPTGAATGWWPPTAGSSPTATPASTAPMGGAPLNQPDRRHGRHPRRPGLLAGGLRRRHLRLRRRRLLRVDGRQPLNRPSWAWPPPPTAGATGWWPPTAASSPSATPASTDRPGPSP